VQREQPYLRLPQRRTVHRVAHGRQLVEAVHNREHRPAAVPELGAHAVVVADADAAEDVSDTLSDRDALRLQLAPVSLAAVVATCANALRDATAGLHALHRALQQQRCLARRRGL
jgi:hypothetical protein